ncbi:hypothetical protein HOY80DRAFT_1141627 [Tuber brumale]|nr:hypothetical protein HOY80DRAFT_1141627 [Tuber brumale]
MAGNNGTLDFLQSAAVQDAITHIAEVNGLSGFEKGWTLKKHTGPHTMLGGRGHSFFIANLVMTIFAIVIVSGRIYSRAFVAGGLGGDDYAMVGAAIVLMCSAGMMSYGVKQAGIGKHLLDLDRDEILSLLKITYALPIVHTLGLFPIKMSLILFYRRLFGPNRSMQRVVKGFMIFETIHTLASSIGFIFICTPVHSWWNIFRRAQDCPTLRQTMAIYVGVRAVSVLTDILVVLLPMRLVWGLKVSVGQKIGLATIFGLGVLTCIAAILRLAFLPKLLLSLDIPWNVVPVSLLGRAEQCLGMITASIPALTALISKSRGRLPPRQSKGSGSSYELSGPGLAKHPAKGFDLLAYAYDPDGVNIVYTTAYAGKTPGRRGRSAGSSDQDLLEEGVRWAEPNTISKTTTVEVKMSSR